MLQEWGQTQVRALVADKLKYDLEQRKSLSLWLERELKYLAELVRKTLSATNDKRITTRSLVFFSFLLANKIIGI